VKGSPSVEHSMVGEGQMRGIQKILSQHLEAVWEFAVVWLHAHKYAKMSHASALNPYSCQVIIKQSVIGELGIGSSHQNLVLSCARWL
jgi:hypothetical protein